MLPNARPNQVGLSHGARSRAGLALPGIGPRAPAPPGAGSSQAARSSRREGLWRYGYALFQGAATVADSFSILFAVAFLGTAVYASRVDASGNLGYTLGAALVVLLVRRFAQYPLLLVVFLAAAALPLLLLGFAHSPVLYLGLYMVFELFWAGAASMAPVVAIQGRPRSQWGEAFARLSEFGALGGLVGLALAGLWMGVGQWAGEVAEGARGLFLLLGIMVFVSTMVTHYGLSKPNAVALHPWGSVGGSPAPGRVSKRPRLLSDQLLGYYLLAFVLSLGMGIAYSGVHLYMVSHLELPIAATLVVLLVFRGMVYWSSRTLARGLGPAGSTQVQSLVALARGLLVALLGGLALVVPSALALPVTLAVVALWGALTAILSVTGLLITTSLTPAPRRAEAIALYNAITNAATILGALLAGALGPSLGYEPMFLIAGGLAAVAALLLLRL